MTSAVAKVLGVTELLEKILLDLPPKDILLSQRVSKDFKELIDGSLKLQRALFFEPVGGPMPKFVWDGLCEKWTWGEENDTKPGLPCWNELLTPAIELNGNNGDMLIISGLQLQLPEPWCREDASWRPMMLTQPPTQEAMLVFAYGRGFRHCAGTMESRVLKTPSGLRMEDIIHECYEVVHQNFGYGTWCHFEDLMYECSGFS